jgi:hypothetical protein
MLKHVLKIALKHMLKLVLKLVLKLPRIEKFYKCHAETHAVETCAKTRVETRAHNEFLQVS